MSTTTFDPSRPNPARPKPARNLVALIIAVTALGPIALNMLMPSMPAIAREFDVDYAVVQYTLTLYLLSVAAGQLIYGPLSDRFGRKPVLIVGICVYIVGCLLGYAAASVGWVIAARIVQALGGCTGMVIGRAMVRDVYDRNHSASILGYVATIMVVAPMVGPAIGALLQDFAGWRFGFLFLAGIAIPVLIWTVLADAETHHHAAAEAAPMIAGVKALLVQPVFLLYCLILGSSTAIFFTFLAGAPLAVIEGMGLSAFGYSMWFMTGAFAYLVGNFISGRYSTRIGPERMSTLGTGIAFGATGVLALTMSLWPGEPLSLFVPVFLFSISQGLTIPNTTAQALSVMPKYAGAAAGLAGFAQVAVGAIATIVIRDEFTPDGLAMTYAMAAFAVVAFAGQITALRLART